MQRMQAFPSSTSFCPYWLCVLDVVSCRLNVNHIIIYIRRFSADVPSFAPVVSCIYSLSSKTLEEGTKSSTTRMDCHLSLVGRRGRLGAGGGQ